MRGFDGWARAKGADVSLVDGRERLAGDGSPYRKKKPDVRVGLFFADGGDAVPRAERDQLSFTPLAAAARMRASAMSLGVAATSMPHSLKTAIFAAAVSSAPPTIAPA